jgi:hypothetical protein
MPVFAFPSNMEEMLAVARQAAMSWRLEEHEPRSLIYALSAANK